MKLLIREFREELALTQSELATQVGTLQRNISNWENGVSEPDCEVLVKLADIFNITLDELFGRERTISNGQLDGFNKLIMGYINKLTETQKLALLQFLREFNL